MSLNYTVARTYQNMGSQQRAIEHLEEALARADELASPPPALHVDCWRAYSMALLRIHELLGAPGGEPYPIFEGHERHLQLEVSALQLIDHTF